MRHRHAFLVLPIVILSACGGAGTNEPPPPPPVDPVFWANIQCDSVDGLAFAITYYLDNKSQGGDVVRFQNKMMSCDGCLKEGLPAGETSCFLEKPGVLTAKTIMDNAAGGHRRWVYTLSQGTIDGMVEITGKDGAITTETFTGHLTR